MEIKVNVKFNEEGVTEVEPEEFRETAELLHLNAKFIREVTGLRPEKAMEAAMIQHAVDANIYTITEALANPSFSLWHDTLENLEGYNSVMRWV